MYTVQLKKHINDFVNAWYFKRTKFSVKTTWKPLHDILNSTHMPKEDFIVMYASSYYSHFTDERMQYRLKINMLSPFLNNEKIADDIKQIIGENEEAKHYKEIIENAKEAYYEVKKRIKD